MWADGILIPQQRKRLGVVGELEFRQPITKVDNCNIADVLFISQIYNVKPELKHNKEQMLRLYSSSPNNAKPNVACRRYLVINVSLMVLSLFNVMLHSIDVSLISFKSLILGL